MESRPDGGIGRHAGLTEASTRRAAKSCSQKKRVRVRPPLGAHLDFYVPLKMIRAIVKVIP
jgi:hypothetical protein